MTQVEWRDRFRNRLNSILYERGISQNRLARDSGLSTSRINEYVSGKAIPTVFAVVNLAYALDTSPGELVDFGERVFK